VLRKTGNAIRMEIADDGKSFREDARSLTRRKQRLGLLGMEERVRQAYGRFSIEPRAGRGTTVRVVIPFKPSTQSPMALANADTNPVPLNNNVETRAPAA
jgi:signal transduction histidine kinase